MIGTAPVAPRLSDARKTPREGLTSPPLMPGDLCLPRESGVVPWRALPAGIEPLRMRDLGATERDATVYGEGKLTPLVRLSPDGVNRRQDHLGNLCRA